MKHTPPTNAPAWTDPDNPVAVPARRADVVVQRLDGEALLFDPATGVTVQLNETALLIWALCDGQRDTHELAERLRDRYEVDQPTARDHVMQVVDTLAQLALLEPMPEANA